MQKVLPLVLPVLVALGGCGGYEPAPAPPTQAKTQSQTPVTSAPSPAAKPAPSPPQQSGMTPGMAAAGAAAGMAPLDAMAGTPSAPQGGQPNSTYQPAQVGVGAKGRDYGGGALAAPVTVPVSVYFSARERITFEIQVPQAMNLYKASNGNAPKSHEEFMEKIIKEQRIPLPELPPGHRYIYDPKTEQLLVEKPANSGN